MEKREARNLIQIQKTKARILETNVQKISQAYPVRLKIPKINVDAAIQYVGVTPTGEMDVPTNPDDVGWFFPGSLPGEKGSAVISGHFNGESGKEGVFADLHKLSEGDKLYIENDKGTAITFVVHQSDTFDPGYADAVFSRNDGSYLNLVTCDGVWDENKKSFSKRLVVFADATTL